MWQIASVVYTGQVGKHTLVGRREGALCSPNESLRGLPAWELAAGNRPISTSGPLLSQPALWMCGNVQLPGSADQRFTAQLRAELREEEDSRLRQ